MKAALLAFLAAAAAAPFRDWSDYRFEDYVTEFGKVHADGEIASRKASFEKELAAVNKHNEEYRAGQHTWYATINKFSDWTELEFKTVKGKASLPKEQHNVAVLLKEQKNPARKDWRDEGVVTPPKNQGACGSCWTFAATEVLESHLAINTGKLLTLAPQTFVNCVKNPKECGGQGGCEGATAELAFNYTAESGIALEADLPYRGQNEKCKKYKPAAKDTGYAHLPSNDADALETALATKGPVAVSVAANWGRYGGGIFSGGCKEKDCSIDHAVVAVGYAPDYWLIRNSWGAAWGEKGYIRLSRKSDTTTYIDTQPADGYVCKPYPKEVPVAGESGVLSDSCYPTGVAPVTDPAAVVV
mmetsp:Transcript_75843/g.142942  ORF Transcript_75843/g.142942 Transcript_75843/m.142942 type:complete len:358 (+) Transcript_75843:77-1150(+)